MQIVPMANPSEPTGPVGAKVEQIQTARERAISKLAAASMPVEAPKAEDVRQEHSIEEAVSTPAVESTAPAKVAEPAVAEEPLSSQYAILARKEKAIRARDAQLRAREEAIKAKEVSVSTPKAPESSSFDESKYISKDSLQKDLFGTLAELGLTYDQITAQATNAPTPEQVAFQQEMKALRDEIKSLRGETETQKKTYEQQQQDSYKQAVTQIRSEANILVKNSEAFETIRETNSVDDVVELIEKTFSQDGILLSVEEAAEQVEDYLIDEAMKIAKIKKIQQRLAPRAPTTPAPAQKQTGTSQQPQLKTLTNGVASTRKLSNVERAHLAFKGQLKK